MHALIHLYKYRSLRKQTDKLHTERIFTHNEIYFAKYTEFNDPFDCNLHVSAEGNFVEHKQKLREINPDFSDSKLDIQTRKDLHPNNIRKQEKKIRADIQRINKNVGIFSMSAIRDNLLMWSHYADSHRGICIQFKVTNDKLFGCDLSKVIYQEEYPNFKIYDKINLGYTRNYLTIKSCDWFYEKEWRILYRETGCQKFPPDELTGVIIGARTSKSNKIQICNWLSKSKCNVQFFQARECENRFGLDIIPTHNS